LADAAQVAHEQLERVAYEYQKSALKRAKWMDESVSEGFMVLLLPARPPSPRMPH
jgi:hypothetical protein